MASAVAAWKPWPEPGFQREDLILPLPNHLFMQVSLPFILITVFVLIGLLLFVILRNRKDEKELEQQLDEDYEKPKKHEDDEDTSV